MHYDFDGAQQKLVECETVIEQDYFLTAIKAEFLESARLFIFETYCRIHQVRRLCWAHVLARAVLHASTCSAGSLLCCLSAAECARMPCHSSSPSLSRSHSHAFTAGHQHRHAV